GGQVGGQVATASGAPEEREQRGFVAVVEDAERLRVLARAGKELCISNLGVSDSRHHPGIPGRRESCDTRRLSAPRGPAPARAADRWWPARLPPRACARRPGR